eukprot:2449784-Amphidinium_carterae.1
MKIGNYSSTQLVWLGELVCIMLKRCTEADRTKRLCRCASFWQTMGFPGCWVIACLDIARE